MKEKLLKQKAELESWLADFKDADHGSYSKHREWITKSVELQEIDEKLKKYN